MFIGHFAVAFAAKRAAPRTSLGVMFVAAQFADMLWPSSFCSAGSESASCPTGIRFSRSTSRAIRGRTASRWAGLGAVFGGLYFAVTRYTRGAIVVGLSSQPLAARRRRSSARSAVVSRRRGATRPRAMGEPKSAIVVEAILFRRARGVRHRDAAARSHRAFRAVGAGRVSRLALCRQHCRPTAAQCHRPGVDGLIGWPLTLWPWWVDRHRPTTTATAESAAAGSAAPCSSCPCPSPCGTARACSTVAHRPRPFQPAFGSSMRPSIHFV